MNQQRIAELHKSGLTLVDMHSHTSISDGYQDPSVYVSFAKKNNFGLCITDHNEVKGNLLAKDKIFNIPSTEVTPFECFDLLFYFRNYKDSELFYNKYLKNNKISEKIFDWKRLTLTAHEIIDYAKDFNAIISIPHPHTLKPKNSFLFFNSNKKNKELLKRVDAIEGINSTMSQERNVKAVNWAFNLNKALTAGSDAHEVHYLGSAMTASFAQTKDDFLEDIGKNKTMILAEPLSKFARNLAGLKILYSNLKII